MLVTSCNGDLLWVSNAPKFAFLFIICIGVGALLGYLISIKPTTHISTRAHYVVKKKTIPYLCYGGLAGAVLAYVLSVF